MKCDDAMDGGFLPEPTNDYPHIEELLSDLENPNFEYGGSTSEYISEPTNDWQKHIRTTSDHTYFKKGESLSEQEYSKHSDKVKERFAYMISHDGQIPDHLRTKKFAQRLLPRRWKDKGPSITTCSLADDFVHYSEPRTLTVREWARLQTFLIGISLQGTGLLVDCEGQGIQGSKTLNEKYLSTLRLEMQYL